MTAGATDPTPSTDKRFGWRSLLAAGVVGLLVGLAPLAITRLPWMQANVFTSDDSALGLALHERPSAQSEASRLQVTPEDERRIARCGAYALAIYDHPIPATNVDPFPGWPSRAEKAFYWTCISGERSTGDGGD